MSTPVLACCRPLAAPSLSDGEAVETARLFKALADPARVALLARLAHGEEVCVCHLVEGSGLSQPTVSHHLGILRRAGFVTSERRGTWAYYRLVPETVRDLARALDA